MRRAQRAGEPDARPIGQLRGDTPPRRAETGDRRAPPATDRRGTPATERRGEWRGGGNTTGGAFDRRGDGRGDRRVDVTDRRGDRPGGGVADRGDRRGDGFGDRVGRRLERAEDRDWRGGRDDRRDGRRDGDWRDGRRDGDRRDGDWRGGDRRDFRGDRRSWRRDDWRWNYGGWSGWDNRDFRRWDRRWRGNRDYDWSFYRNANRFHYRPGPYYAPFRGHRYSRLDIGFYLDSLFFQPRFFINDPWDYRLPPVYGPYRWVRYYDDVVLVDVYTGEVVDVIYDFFW